MYESDEQPPEKVTIMNNAIAETYAAVTAAIQNSALSLAADILAAAQSSRFANLGDSVIAMIRADGFADLASVLTGEMVRRAQGCL